MTAVLPAAGNGRVPSAAPAVTVCAVAGGLSFRPAVSGDRLFVLLAVAAVLPVLLAVVLGRARRRPLWMDVLVSGVAWWLAAAVLLPWPDGLAGSLGGPGRALGRGVQPLLEWVPPAPAQPELLVVPFLLTWLAATTGAELATRGAPGPAAALPAWCVWIFAVTFAVPASGQHVATAAALLAATVWLARPLRRASVGVAVTGILLASTGIAVAAAYGGHGAHDVRSAFPADKVPDDVLAEYDHWRAAPAEPLFEVKGPALGPGDGRWRLAELAGPDRDRWVTSTGFRRTGGSGGTGADDRTVTVTGLRSAFLPTLGSVTATAEDTEIWAAAGTSMVVRADRDTPVSYSVRTEPVGGPPSDADVAVPDGCDGAATELTGRAAPDRGAFDAAGADAAAARLATFLGPAATTPAGGEAGVAAPYGCSSLALAVRDRQATEVQRALAYVLAVRSAGIPARIVVGFTDPGTATRRTITGADARVWSDVWADGRWVAVTVPTAGTAVPLLPPPPSPPPDATIDPPRSWSGPFDGDHRRTLLVLLAILLLLASAGLGGRLLSLLSTRSVARAARRRGSAADRMAAAWRDTVRELSRPGPAVPTGATPREVVAGATGLPPEAADALRSLAHDVVDVLYGGAEPEEKTVAAAWRRRDDVARAVRGRARRGGRRSPRTEAGKR